MSMVVHVSDKLIIRVNSGEAEPSRSSECEDDCDG